MTTEEIIRMAREQGLPETEVEGVFRVNSDDLGRLLAAERNRLHDKPASKHDTQRSIAKGKMSAAYWADKVKW